MSAGLPELPSDWANARVAVVGLARSGVAASLFLRRRGARVVATDRRPANELGSVASDLERAGVELSLGHHPDLKSFDAIVLSPGVPPHQEFLEDARQNGVPLLPEMELGAREAPGRIVAITGTKGKSTTTLALAAMLKAGGHDARAVGNIGEPITARLDGADARSIFVVEASSFQLETTRDFHPHCAVFLNLFPDHLDRHPSFEAYAEAKAKIFSNQTAEDAAIVNAEDPAVMDLAKRTAARVIPFRPRSAEGPGAGFEEERAVLRNGSTAILFEERDVTIPGTAVRANLLAAATAAHHLGVRGEDIARAVRGFHGAPHTFERIGELRGVAFINDSKATTIESVKVALEAFAAPVLAIMGGRLKAGSFRSLRDAVGGRVRAIYAIGESRSLVSEALSAVCPVHETDTLEQAVQQAFAAARPGETVLLSPGCASFDMFRDYAERGEAFRRCFRDLALKGAA